MSKHVWPLYKPCTDIQVAIVAGFHLFPFRTEKLSPFTPMVLRKWESRSPPSLRELGKTIPGSLSFFVCPTCAVPWHCFSSAYAERGKWESRSPPSLRRASGLESEALFLCCAVPWPCFGVPVYFCSRVAGLFGLNDYICEILFANITLLTYEYQNPGTHRHYI